MALPHVCTLLILTALSSITQTTCEDAEFKLPGETETTEGIPRELMAAMEDEIELESLRKEYFASKELADMDFHDFKACYNTSLKLLLTRRSMRNVTRATHILRAISRRVQPPPSSNITWRPTLFPEDPYLGNVSLFATNSMGTVDLPNGMILVKESHPLGGHWHLQPKDWETTVGPGKPLYIYGDTEETLLFYGLGAGAPSPDTGVEKSSSVEEGGRRRSFQEVYESYGFSPDEIKEAFEEFGFGSSGSTSDDVDKPAEDMAGWRNLSEAVFFMGLLSSTGFVPEIVEANDTKAFEYYRLASDLGSVYASLTVASSYERGRGVSPSCRAAAWYYKIVADDILLLTDSESIHSDPASKALLKDWHADASYLDRNSDPFDSPLQVVEEHAQAENGHPGHIRNRGVRRLEGRGVPRNPQLALRDFQEAADLGDVHGLFNLGYMHLNGIATPVNYTAARALFSRAASMKFPPALNSLGVMLFNGYGTPVDHSLARRYFEKAALLGNGDAAYNMALTYLEGRGAARNASLALHWFLKATHAGHGRAPYSLAYMFAEGEGTAVNCQMSVLYFKRFISARWTSGLEMRLAFEAYRSHDYWEALLRYAIVAQSGEVAAMHNVAFMLARGQGFSAAGADRSMAANYLRQASEQGSTKAMVDLGHLEYQDWLMGGRNLNFSSRWYRAAASMGNLEGVVCMAYVHQMGLSGARNDSLALTMLRRAYEDCRNEDCVPVMMAIVLANFEQWRYLVIEVFRLAVHRVHFVVLAGSSAADFGSIENSLLVLLVTAIFVVVYLRSLVAR